MGKGYGEELQVTLRNLRLFTIAVFSAGRSDCHADRDSSGARTCRIRDSGILR
jgi:hypothetical protein